MRLHGYAKARTLISKEFKVSPSMGAMSAAYQKWSSEEQEANLLRAAVDIENIEEMTAQLGEADDVLRQQLNHAALAALVGGDPDQIKLLVNLALQAKHETREDAKLRLRIQELEDKQAEAKAAIDKAVKAAANGGGLSEEALVRIEEAAKIL